MTALSPDRRHAAGDGPGRGIRPDHRRVGLSKPAPEPPGPTDIESELREILAPFVAWLATQDLDESARRRHRAVTERFLRWSRADTGSAGNRRRRYEQHLRHHDPDHLGDARAGLSWWTDYRRIVSLTQLTGH